MPIAQAWLSQTDANPDHANLWMNLAIVMQCLGMRDLGVQMQAQALALQRIYPITAARHPARLRLLLLMTAGDIAENTPIECLLEESDIELVFYFVDRNAPSLSSVPEHDVLMLAMADSQDNRGLFAFLVEALQEWPKPVINAPQNIPATDRERASQLLQNLPGLDMPPTLRGRRDQLQAVAANPCVLGQLFPGLTFPLILRPVGSQAGRDLEKIEEPAQILHYLARVEFADFFLSRFVEYRSSDGQFRKFRIALIDGEPYVCHMAVSSNWMVHYVNAGMYEDARKREEEAGFMAKFDDFVRRHRPVLQGIHQRIRLDYFCIDCAETLAGDLLVFEVDHVMVVHAMDPEDLFPYKQRHMRTVKQAFEDYLCRLAGDACGQTKH